MVVKKMALAALLVLTVAGCTGPGDSDTVRIGITQIVEHPALDAARQGFIAGLAEEGYTEGENLQIEFQSAQGEIANAQLIAENFAADEMDMILAISTDSAQMAFQVTKEIPIMITAVTDPVQAGLAESWDRSGTNVTGTSDSAPVDKHLDLIRQLLPQAAKLGIIYNTSEVNSEIQVDKVRELAVGFGLEVIAAGVTDISDIQIVLESLLPQVDVLYTPTDNLIASSMGLVSEVALNHKTPIIGSEEAQVKAGALATQGIDYFQLGFETGQMAARVLQGESPSEMGIMTLRETRLLINSDTAERLGIIIPDGLAEQADFVGTGQ